MSRLNVANFRHPDGTADNINLDSSGRVLVGTSSWSGGYTGQVIEGNSTSSTGPGVVYLARGAESPTAGQDLGEINFSNTTGDQGAQIIASADGAWATDDYPGRLEFHTTADGASSPTEAMRLDSSQNLRFNSGYGSVATAYGCRAWVNFQGDGTVDIRADGNVSSITDHGTGDYTVSFTTALPDDDYCVVGSVVGNSTGPYHSFVASAGASLATSSCRINIINANSSQYDLNVISVAVIR